ncbi:MAG TPA: LacI family DNA-binding transcriptional regulator [Gemmatimonadales bacterium]|nr:LacI family DNA-binding transcriptional regulator [Gemmatimonadales bacterium]
MITIKDVARQAGVSVATVSRVYSGRDPVSEHTRIRVCEVGARLGYAPHGAAQSLITNRTNTIGVLLPDLYGEFFSEVIRGIDQTARRQGYHVLVSSAHQEPAELEAALRAMRGRVDGMIIMAPDLAARAQLASLPTRFPTVLLNRSSEGRHAGSIAIANHAGAHAMVSHLISLGHERIATITGSDGNLDAAERLGGYREALADAGLPNDPALEAHGDFDEHSGFAAAERLLALDRPPTALFAANDSMAIGALSAIRQAGLQIPEDIAVAGFDDIPLARYMDPPLTSVHVDISALGERAARRLLDAMAQPGRGDRTDEILPATLVVRASCGAPSGGARALSPASIHS